MSSSGQALESIILSGQVMNIKEMGCLLIEKGISISCCESCTGGLFASLLVNVPGISEVFDRGLVTYSNKAKMEELGVKKETLDKFTAESYEVAEEMARGLYEKTGSRICISSTGVAGPGAIGDNAAGNMWIGIAVDGEVTVRELKSGRDSREWNRIYCTRIMIHEVTKRCREI
ncbi:MAG: CinA family protein [Firmicutes bacterium]|nr:CinA family protein [Bacillota bacterium]